LLGRPQQALQLLGAVWCASGCRDAGNSFGHNLAQGVEGSSPGIERMTPSRCYSRARFMFRLTRQNCAVRYPHWPPHTDHTVWARPADHLPPPGQPGYGPPPGGPTPTGPKPRRISLRGPLSIVVIAVIVVSLVAGGACSPLSCMPATR
jgi:hypothetical protein